MAVRSRDFVGIAEGIKSHELSTKGKIESLKGTISELSSRKSTLDNQISYLEAALSAAYEDTDEDGDPDYGRISAIESQINAVEGELSGVESQLDGAQGELSQSEAELESVMEEKAQTLFEIQERARKTSQNISVAGGMYGAYSGVGGSLQGSLQASLSSLSQAASILDGSVDSAGGGGSSNSGDSSGPGRTSSGDLSTGALSAFAGGANPATASLSEGGTGVSAPSDFSTNHTGEVTPATTPNFHSGQKSINPQKTLNFNSDQSGNTYATSSFSESGDDGEESTTANFSSSQASPAMEARFQKKGSNDGGNSGSPRGDLEKRRAWAQQYQVGFTPVASSTPNSGSGSSSSAPDRGQRELDDELEHAFSLGTIFSKNKGNTPTSSASVAKPVTAEDQRKAFMQRLHAEVKDVPDYSTATSSGSSDDDHIIGPRELSDELERAFSFGTVFSKNKGKTPTPSTPAAKPVTAEDQRKAFMQRLHAEVKDVPDYSTTTSSGSSDDDHSIGERIRDRATERPRGDYERNILSAFGLGHLAQSIGRKAEQPAQVRNQILNNQATHISARNQLLKEPRSLTKTAQTWTKGAGGTLTYNSPIETGKKLDFQQGKVNNFLGTCGLCSCENVLRMAGVPVSEADIVKYASTTYEETDGSFVASLTRKTLCVTNSAPSSNGGTSAATRKKILDHFGVPSYTAPQSVQTIADAVSKGHGVIASVHAETLYFARRPIHPDLHAITITSVQKDSGGNILGFYVCDSNAAAFGGTGATYYTAEEIERALSDRECNITSTIIR